MCDFELIAGEQFFQYESSSSQMVLLEVMEVTGRPPQHCLSRWEEALARVAIFQRDVGVSNDVPERFEKLIKEIDDESTNKELPKDLLKRMLTWEPAERRISRSPPTPCRILERTVNSFGEDLVLKFDGGAVHLWFLEVMYESQGFG